ncbi:hypothetical protein ACFOY2_46290 [Nonomuraea purpurea]|uniref:Collagen-like protein n=1 Tax=Nonomuraea purpurea TaxID=1849276 RepID=A0ABV8GP21_9ACTN
MSRHLAPLVLAQLRDGPELPPDGHVAVYPDADGTLVATAPDGTTVPVSGAGPQGEPGEPGQPGEPGEAGPPGPGVLPPYVIDGPLTVAAGTYRLWNDTGRAWTITSVRASVVAPPTGGGVRVDINLNGTSIFASAASQPTIPDGGTTAKATSFATAVVPDGGHLTVDVDAIGTTAPGAKLSVQVTVT